eukprot:gnl/Trimastix_PCT/1126.p2 GENE.gnl/Trimastix_PCT/1126~~gnl/Trimastix_PCT/1126.p2  ORF type:complete len:388 (+),score=71.56 gnl/Trimastix_PCT/1126:2677-3840(+)
MAAPLTTITVKLNLLRGLTVQISTDRTVGDLKEEIARIHGYPAEHQSLILAGQRLRNEEIIGRLLLQGASSVHLTIPSDLMPRRSEFTFRIYCKDCVAADPADDGIGAGLLHIQCRNCGRELTEMETEPRCWEDLTNGTATVSCPHCHQTGPPQCSFRCVKHPETMCAPLFYLQEIPGGRCSVCNEPSSLLVALKCRHTFCLEHFCEYVEQHLRGGHFHKIDHGINIGFTTGCKFRCSGSEIIEMHLFRILSKALYDKIKDDGNDIVMIEMGYSRCPKCSEWGAPPDIDLAPNKIQCEACRHRFCKLCKGDQHNGPCPPVERLPGIQDAPAPAARVPAVPPPTKHMCSVCNSIVQSSNNHLRCDNGHETCAICRGPWTPACLAKHPF